MDKGEEGCPGPTRGTLHMSCLKFYQYSLGYRDPSKIATQHPNEMAGMSCLEFRQYSENMTQTCIWSAGHPSQY